MTTLTTRLIAVTTAYLLCGWLALFLALPPGYTAPFFPPTGIAFAAILVFGPRMLPAIWIGALGVGLLAAQQTGYSGSALTGILVSSLGAPLQALVVLVLTRKFVGWPSPLDRPRSISRFLGLVLPISCLTNAGISVPALTLSGIIPATDALFNWWNWWLGDTFGAVIITPVLLTFLAHPKDDWRSRRSQVTIPMAICLAVVAYTFYVISDWEARRIEASFHNDADHVESLIKSRLNTQVDMVSALAGWVATTPAPSRDRFLQFVSPFLSRYPGTQNFAWSPMVTQDDRRRFEATMEKEWPGFKILSRDSEGKTFVADEAPRYLPLTFIEPAVSNQKALGLDILKLSTTADTVLRARASGNTEATPPFRLVQEVGHQRGIVIYRVVFNDEGPRSEERTLRGIVSSALRMDDTIAAALAGHTGEPTDICLVDEAAPIENRRLYGAEGCESAHWPASTPRVRTEISFAGRPWTLVQYAKPTFALSQRNWAAWLALSIGLTTVGMLGAFLLITTGNARRIANLVRLRTTELAEAQRMARLGSWEWNPGEKALWTSPELVNLLGELPTALTLEGLIQFFRLEDQLPLTEALASARRTPQILSLDARPLPGPGRVEVTHVQIESEWSNGELRSIRGTIQDVSAARAAEAHIHHLAHYDSLTGLPNRSLWMTRARAAVAAAMRHDEKLAVLFLDLDQFKTVNDSLGHAAGDRLLKAVAYRLKGCLREEDLLARLGGDEFVILMERLGTPDDAGSVARKILETISLPLILDDNELVPMVSIGIALFPSDGGDLDSLLKQADVAMYDAKDGGRNSFRYFRPEMTARVSDRLTLEAALRRGIERNELVVYYQPQILPESRKIVGAEALVRWNRPDRGLVPPDQFIPLAEESGLILPLGEWVMREVFRQQANWSAMGLETIQLSVNVSASQLLRPDFVDKVLALVAETGANPAFLELEITESALVEASPELVAALARLREVGITLALDDFGTGYSCLAYLKRLPISRLKIDRSFVRDIPGDPEDTAITLATLSLARNLGMETVAEGVENLEQQTFLMGKGCHCMQGFLFHRPMPAGQLEALLGRRNN